MFKGRRARLSGWVVGGVSWDISVELGLLSEVPFTVVAVNNHDLQAESGPPGCVQIGGIGEREYRTGRACAECSRGALS